MLALAVAVAAGGPLLSTAPAAAQERAAGVVVDEVVTQPMTQTTPVVGRIVARESVIAAEVEGTVAVVHKRIGDRVERGEPILELDKTRLESAVDQRRADLAEAQANAEAAAAGAEQARQALERTEGLRGSSAFSQARLDEAQQIALQQSGLRRVAEARRDRAEVALRLAEADLADATIIAPFDGAVGDRSAHVGEYLRIGSPIVTLINDTDLEVEAAVPTDRVSALAPGTPVTLTLDDGSRHDAVVRAVVPREDPATRTRTVRFTPDFGATDRILAGDQAVTVEIPSGPSREVVTVHKDAIIVSPRGRMVYVAADGQAQPRPVTVGASVGDRFEVIDGLAPGDLVVVRGNERLRPGQPIQFDQAS
ncbi:MAG: efflux RND transporter periplasmic adaptor subunit [Alphaproteobacteria bacterium]|jgi:RND family efflux transporter MFP subunit|nr:efflux RND transporter periplasmic adaptor subunit [Alphaproteobacteria bacterium]